MGGGHSCYEGGHRAHGGSPTRENPGHIHIVFGKIETARDQGKFSNRSQKSFQKLVHFGKIENQQKASAETF